MLTGLPLLFVITGVLLLIVLACTLFRWHPFLVLLLAAIVLALAAGLSAQKTMEVLLQGGGAVFASIGFIIALGTLLGEVLEKTGAITALASALLKRLGEKRVLPGMSLLGAFTGIPVFCDSGFLILSRLAHSVADRSAVSVGAISLALATGLYTTHVLVPPTPGPLAAIGNLGLSDHTGLVLLLGLVTSVPAVATGWLLAKQFDRKKIAAIPTAAVNGSARPIEQLPPAIHALLPLLLPIVLIAGGSLTALLAPAGPAMDVLRFLTHPVIALLAGVLLAFALLGGRQRKEWNSWIQQALHQAGPVLLITTAGGALGAVIKATPLAQEFGRLLEGKQFPVLLFYPIAYGLAAGLKTAQGSSTAALIVASSILMPLMPELPFTHIAQQALVVISIGAGAMTVSHANDSYFWVVSQYGGLAPRHMYRYFTTATFFMGLSVLFCCMVLSLFF